MSLLVAQLEAQLGEQDSMAAASRAGGASFERINQIKLRFDSLSRLRDQRVQQLAVLKTDITALYDVSYRYIQCFAVVASL